MGTPVLVLLVIFGSLFGIFYLYFSTRNKERLALIEKGADAKIFARNREYTAPIWKVLVLNLSMLLTGIGIGAIITSLVYHFSTIHNEGIGVGIIFLTAGLGLLAGFFLTKKYLKE